MSSSIHPHKTQFQVIPDTAREHSFGFGGKGIKALSFRGLLIWSKQKNNYFRSEKFSLTFSFQIYTVEY